MKWMLALALSLLTVSGVLFAEEPKDQTEKPAAKADSAAVEKKLDSMILANVDLREVTVSEAADAIKKAAISADPAGKGIDINVNVTDKQILDRKISMAFHKTPLRQALTQLCKQAGLEFKVKADGMVEVTAKPETDIKKKLNNIVMDHVEFSDAQVETVIAFLRKRAKELDPDGKGINIVVSIPKDTKLSTITMEMDDIPVGKLLEYICMSAGLSMTVEENVVIIKVKEKEKAGTN